MKSQSSQYRTQTCGLPPKLAFSPSRKFSKKCNNNDAADIEQQMLISWKNQLREEDLWNDAQTSTRHLLREIMSFYAEKDTDGKTNAIADGLIQQFGRRIVHHLTSTNGNNPHDIQNKQHDFETTWLTIHDIETIAQILQDHHGAAAELPNEFVQKSQNKSIVKHCIREKQVVESNNTTISWYEVLMIPYEDAAQDILQIYNQNTSKQNIQQYLNYRSIRTMEQVQYFTLPSQKQQLVQLQEYHCKQQQLLTKLERYYNDAFETLDDYCMNVLGVESDTLPLFPEQRMTAVGSAVDVETDTRIAQVIDEYADQVASHVRPIMMDELNKASGKFISILGDNSKVIATAIEYYLQFTDFLSSAQQWRDNGQECAKDDKNEVMMMSTLKKFVTSSSSSDSLISQFIQSPSTRVMLVSDLQQLNAFLTSRKRELSSRVGSGRDVMEAINLAWTQHCITTIADASAGYNFSDVTLEDISQYNSAVQNVLEQIVGDGVHARRLRLLADSLGCLSTDKEEAFRFKLLCRRAAVLAHQMSLYQSQQEASTLTMERCKLDVEMKDEEIRLDTSRLEVLKTMTSK